MGSSLLGATATALLGFGTTFMLATTLVLTAGGFAFGASFVLVAFCFHLAGRHLLAAGAGTFLASAALGIGGAVAGCIAAATVLAGAELLFRALAVGLLAAFGSFLAASSGLASTESVDILLNSTENHFANTL